MRWWDHVEKGTLTEVVDMETIHKLKEWGAAAKRGSGDLVACRCSAACY
jgi:hypothetical protein